MLTRTWRRYRGAAAGALALTLGAPAFVQAQQTGLFPLAPIRRERVPCPSEEPVYGQYRRQYYGYFPTCWHRFPPGWGCPSAEAPNAALEFQKLKRQEPPTDEERRDHREEGPGPLEPEPLPGNRGPAPLPDDRNMPPLPRGERSPFDLDAGPTTPGPGTTNPPPIRPPVDRNPAIPNTPSTSPSTSPRATPSIPGAGGPRTQAPAPSPAPARTGVPQVARRPAEPPALPPIEPASSPSASASASASSGAPLPDVSGEPLMTLPEPLAPETPSPAPSAAVPPPANVPLPDPSAATDAPSGPAQAPRRSLIGGLFNNLRRR